MTNDTYQTTFADLTGGTGHDSAECPTCGDRFDTSQAMKLHHAHAHGESIAGFEIECSACSKPFRAEWSERKYCSEECRDDGFRSRVKVDCATCGETMSRKPSRVEQHEQLYCSYECLYSRDIDKSGGYVECGWCGDEIYRMPCILEMKDRHFCGRDCYREWLSENRVGENHPQYLGGDRYYGENWYKQREEALKRDEYTCQRCGMNNDECVDEFGSGLHVHHITPRREFDDIEDANELDNLRTLCHECHYEVDEAYRLGALLHS